MSEQETVFAAGMFFNSKHDNAPDFVLGSISFKADEFITFLQTHKKADGYVNVDFLRGRPKDGEAKGKPYFKLNTWKPKTDVVNPVPANPAPAPQTDHRTHDRLPDYPEENIDPEDVPF